MSHLLQKQLQICKLRIYILLFFFVFIFSALSVCVLEGCINVFNVSFSCSYTVALPKTGNFAGAGSDCLSNHYATVIFPFSSPVALTFVLSSCENGELINDGFCSFKVEELEKMVVRHLIFILFSHLTKNGTL